MPKKQHTPLAKYFYDLRQDKGVSLKDIEIDTGIKSNYLHLIETTVAKLPEPDKLRLLSKYYGVPIDNFLAAAGYKDKSYSFDWRIKHVSRSVQKSDEKACLSQTVEYKVVVECCEKDENGKICAKSEGDGKHSIKNHSQGERIILGFATKEALGKAIRNLNSNVNWNPALDRFENNEL